MITPDDLTYYEIVASGQWDSHPCEIEWASEVLNLRLALEQIVRECGAMNKGPVAVMIARKALEQ